MRLALFDDYRLGVVQGDEVIDVTEQVSGHDSDPLTAGWWRAFCRDFDRIEPRIRAALTDSSEWRALSDVNLRPPVLNPSKIVAVASNYEAHVDEMHEVQRRTLGHVESWMMRFDVFLKAPSSIIGTGEEIVLPPEVVEAGQEIHHESEFVIVMGRGGKDLTPEEALDHVLGYTIGLDITVRSAADRSRRKSYDTFSPIGPWVRTPDDDFDPSAVDLRLTVNGETRQDVNTRDLNVGLAGIVSYASRMMTLLPGDVIFTGAPPGVGPIHAGDRLSAVAEGIGELTASVR